MKIKYLFIISFKAAILIYLPNDISGSSLSKFPLNIRVIFQYSSILHKKCEIIHKLNGKQADWQVFRMIFISEKEVIYI